eukprot:jgi/Astpho2/1074/Aster-x0045
MLLRWLHTAGPTADQRRQLEDQLKDPSNFAEFFLPRPLRLTLFGSLTVACAVALLVTLTRLVRCQRPSAEAVMCLQDASFRLDSSSEWQGILVNLAGLVTFAALYLYDERNAVIRVEKRAQAQIRAGDREVYVTEEGDKMSKLKQDMMPFVGPEKGAIIQQLVRELQPNLVVEVGSLCGYSAITLAQALPPSARLITIEKDFLWTLAAKRFIYQAGYFWG